MKDYKRMTGSKLENQIIEALALHESMQGCYYWKPPNRLGGNKPFLADTIPSTASGRRQMEKQKSLNLKFSFKGDVYEIDLATTVSCKTVYYRSCFTINGAVKNVRIIKKLI